MEEKALTLLHVTKKYDRPIIRDLSYTFECGKLYVIKGVSGCGKTTLLNLIGGIDRSFSGEIRGNECCSYLFQSSLLLSGLTVWENLLLIKNDSSEIKLLSRELGIDVLLNKYPNQLSGGERQRVSIVRALLQSPHVLLADEPTASLDAENSQNIAQIIAGLKHLNRILIVATHEKYFDAYADQIIHLHYGTIEGVVCNDPLPIPETRLQAAPKTKQKTAPMRAFCYARKRNPKLLKTTGTVPLVLAFLLILFVFTLQNNFESAYLQSIKNRYPMDMIVFNPVELEQFSRKDELKLYDQYIAKDGDVLAYHLLPEKDSVFAIHGMIAFGKFPSKEQEILVSQSFADAFLHTSGAYSACIGKSIVFQGISWTVSGVAADFSDRTVLHNLYADAFYQRQQLENAIFIPYSALVQIGEKQDSPFVIGVYDGLLEDAEAYQALELALYGSPNQFYADIRSSQQIISRITYLFVAVLFISFITASVFMVTIIKTELYYRRKELGFLQIFGVNKGRLQKLVIAEYSLKLAFSFACAFLLFASAVLIYYLRTKTLLLPNIPMTLFVICSLSFIYVFSAYRSVRGFLKRSVISLIS